MKNIMLLINNRKRHELLKKGLSDIYEDSINIITDFHDNQVVDLIIIDDFF